MAVIVPSGCHCLRNIMTVQELLITEGFDRIMNALQTTHRSDSSIQCVAGYKEAYDIITHIKFEGEGGKVTFDVTPKEKWYSLGYLPMLANDVEGDLWENIVGKEVVKPTDNPFTDAELAGAILWGMTFYGFTPRCTEDFFDNQIIHTAFTKYGRMVKQLKIKRDLPYATMPGMREDLKRQMKEEGDCMTYYLSTEEWDFLAKRRQHLNRSKRKREYRLAKRIEWLKKLDKRQHLLDKISAAIYDLPSTIDSDIFQAGAITETWRESHTYGDSNRVDYILNLLSLPHVISEILSGNEKTYVCCYTSADSLMSHEEQTHLQAFICNHGKNVSLLFGTAPNIAPGELALQFIGIRDMHKKR